jgi:hypothetical protein
MSQPWIEQLAADAERIYRERFQAELERHHPDEFVAIEPESGKFFLGRTLSAAMRAARQAFPTRRAYVMRVGHDAAVHFGMHLR